MRLRFVILIFVAFILIYIPFISAGTYVCPNYWCIPDNFTLHVPNPGASSMCPIFNNLVFIKMGGNVYDALNVPPITSGYGQMNPIIILSCSYGGKWGLSIGGMGPYGESPQTIVWNANTNNSLPDYLYPLSFPFCKQTLSLDYNKNFLKPEHVCNNSFDDDCDGLIDCRDVDCGGQECLIQGRTKGICISGGCVKSNSAQLTINPEYLNHLPVNKEDYLKETFFKENILGYEPPPEVPFTWQELNHLLVVSPYDQLMCKASFLKVIDIKRMSKSEIEQINKSELNNVEFSLQGPGSKGVMHGYVNNVKPSDSSIYGNYLHLTYYPNYTFQGVGDENRGKNAYCEVIVYPDNGKFNEELTTESEDVVVAKYLLHFMYANLGEVKQELIDNYKSYYNYFVGVSDVNLNLEQSMKPIFYNVEFEAKLRLGTGAWWAFLPVRSLFSQMIKALPMSFNQDFDTIVGIFPIENIEKICYFGASSCAVDNGVFMPPSQGNYVLAHELGHAIGHLVDEYSYSQWKIESLIPGWGGNPISSTGEVRFPKCCLIECIREGGNCLSNCKEYGLETLKYSCGSDNLQCCQKECEWSFDCPKGEYCHLRLKKCLPNGQIEVVLPSVVSGGSCSDKLSNLCLGMPYKDESGNQPDDVKGPFPLQTHSIMGSISSFSNKVYPKNAPCPLRCD